MSILPTTFRTPESSKTGSVLQQLSSNLRELARQEQQIASGRLYSRMSDNPLATRRIVSWEVSIVRSEKYQANVQLAGSRLGASESSFDEFQSVIATARNLALQQLNDPSANQTTRMNASIEISSLIDEAVTLSNRKFGDRYLFGGSEVRKAPFVREGDSIVYRGDERRSQIQIASGMYFSDSVTGARAFGGTSSEIVGRSDLNPVLTAATGLGELNEGRGIDLGMVEIRDGLGGREFVDLTNAKTMTDVVAELNSSGLVTASINAAGNGLNLAGVAAGADLDILDVNGNRTARDLGIATLNAGPAVLGGDLSPVVLRTTPLANLLGGLGLDNSGFSISNGPYSATIDTSQLATVEDLLNAIDASGTNTFAEISSDGKRLSIRSNMAGAELNILENGGNTAEQLGLFVESADQSLEALNGGTGVFENDGADFSITLSDGTLLQVDIAAAKTLGEVAQIIENATGAAGKLSVEVVAGEDRLRLVDTAGGADEISVSPIEGSFTAANLGIDGVASGGVLEGTDLNPSGVRLESAFDGLVQLFRGLVNNDRQEINSAVKALDAADQRLLETRGEVGSELRRLQVSQRRIEIEVLEMRELVSLEGDTDLAKAIVEFQQQQTIYQAALQTAGNLLRPTLLDFLG